MIEQMKMGETIFNYNRYSERKIDDRQQVNTFNGVLGNKSALATSQTKTSEVEGTQSVSLENMLKEKLSIELISRVTGLKEEKIKKIQKDTE